LDDYLKLRYDLFWVVEPFELPATRRI